MPKVKTQKTYVKRKKYLLRYDLDLLSKQALIEIFLIIEDDTTNIVTPVTPLYQARFEPYSRTAKRNFKPRELDCCFVANNVGVRRTVYIPYLPGSINHKAQTREYSLLEAIATLTYKGESHVSNYESFV
ncbi:MAG: hypothetical protein ACRC2R_16870 [Xenococcaceae cyanobacterium]